MVRPVRRPRRARKMRPRKPRRAAGGAGKLGRKAVYNYSVNLLPEYLVSCAGVPPGEMPLVTDQATPAPLRAGTGLSSSTQGVPDASAAGLPNYWSFAQAIPFALNDLQNYTAFTTQYDYYRINSITCTVTYKANSISAGDINPTMYVYVDNDDAILPTKQQQVIGRQGIKRWEFNNKATTKYSITFKPKFKVMSGVVMGNEGPGSIGTTGITKPSTGWLDCNAPAVQHFGLKIWAENVPLVGGTGAVPNVCLQYEFKYNLSFKAPINQF